MLRTRALLLATAACLLSAHHAQAQEPGESRYGVLVVEGDPSDPVRVFINGNYEGTAPVSLKLRPGAYDVLLEWGAGGPLKQFHAAIRPAETKGLRVPARPVEPVEPAGPVQPVTTTIVTAAVDEEIPMFEWALIGGGLTAALAGGILHYLAFARNDSLIAALPPPAAVTEQEYGAAVDKFNHDFDTKVAPLATTAYVLYAIGGGAVITGTALMLLAPEEQGSSPFLQPTLSPEGPGFLLQGRF